MKRLGWILLVAGAMIMSGGAGFNFFMSLNTCGEACIKARLDGILRAMGYAVRWDAGKYEHIPLYLREQLEKIDRGELENVPREQMVERLRQARLIHFMEVEVGTYFFFLERPFFLSPGVKVGKVEEELKAGEHSFNPRDAGLVHIHNGSFQVLVLGKLLLSEEEVENSFPFEEVKGIATWQNEAGRKVQRYTTLLGIVFLLFGGGSVGFLHLSLLYRKQPQAVGEKILFSRPARERIKKIESRLPDSAEIVREETIDPEAMRGEFLKEIEVMIEQSDGEERIHFERIRASLKEEQPRLSKLEYHVNQARRMFSGVMEEEEVALGVVREEEAETFSAPQEIDFRSKEGLDNLLPIRNFVPKFLNPEHVQKIILWGFLRPTRSVKLVNGYYAPIEEIVNSIVGKGLSLERVKEGIEWLASEFIIFSRESHPRHPGEDNFSLQINPKRVVSSPEAKEIVRISGKALQELTKNTRRG